MPDNRTILGQGFVGLPSGTTAERPASPALGYTWYNTTLNAVESYHSTGWITLSNIFLAEGGTVQTYTVGGTTYKSHTFTTSGTFSVTSGTSNVDYLIVAGGAGGGGGRHCGAGGAGGMTSGTTSLNIGNYSITVGGGGGGGAGGGGNGGTGNNSSFSGITMIGGGWGGGHPNSPDENGGSGGSGGGGAHTGTNGGAGTS
jgi:hypothetical protein